MKFITFKEQTVAYQVEGKGNVLVLLHGFCSDSSVWNNMIENLKDLKIIRIDLPGFGASPAIEDNSIELMADIVHAVLQEVGVEKCVLIGHSMGGYISLAFAKKYGQYLIGLGLFHSHPYADSDLKKKDRQKGIRFIDRNGHILYVKQLIPALFSKQFIGSNAFLMNSLIYSACQYSAKGIQEAQQAMLNRIDQTPTLEQVDCPVLFIIGRADELISVASALKQTTLPATSEVHILERSGHMGMLEEKEKSRKIILNFVNRVN